MSLKDFNRTDDMFSLCGLNCGLCGYRLQGHCSGCFKDSFCAKICPMAPCSVKHGNIQYCFECPEYPCRHYEGFDSYDNLGALKIVMGLKHFLLYLAFIMLFSVLSGILVNIIP